MNASRGDVAAITRMDVSAYRVPTEQPESDGTFAWDATTLVVVSIEAAGRTGLGYTYADKATATLIHERYRELLEGKDALATAARWSDMVADVRNTGRAGVAAMAISAVDNALWDWKARFLDLPLVTLLGDVREGVTIYGSGGFTSYTQDQLRQQLEDWAGQGMRAVKIKVGRVPQQDVARVHCARAAIGNGVRLFVDANGAYARKQALAFARQFATEGVSWFEEPVSSDDLPGLKLLRDSGPPGMAIAAGEYGYESGYFRRMLETQAVDVLQADATRCCGVTGFLGIAALCEAFHIPLSSHCAPSLHLHVDCAARSVIHMEYFLDHVRIEHMLFDGARDPLDGVLTPDRSRPGLGLELRYEDAACYRI